MALMDNTHVCGATCVRGCRRMFVPLITQSNALRRGVGGQGEGGASKQEDRFPGSLQSSRLSAL